jgi:hypothetical protein
MLMEWNSYVIVIISFQNSKLCAHTIIQNRPKVSTTDWNRHIQPVYFRATFPKENIPREYTFEMSGGKKDALSTSFNGL